MEGTPRGHEQLDGGAGGQPTQGSACCPHVIQKPLFTPQRNSGFPLPACRLRPAWSRWPRAALHPGDVEIIAGLSPDKHPAFEVADSSLIARIPSQPPVHVLPPLCGEGVGVLMRAP